MSESEPSNSRRLRRRAAALTSGLAIAAGVGGASTHNQHPDTRADRANNTPEFINPSSGSQEQLTEKQAALRVLGLAPKATPEDGQVRYHKIESYPAFKHKLNPEAKSKIMASAVKILRRRRGSMDGWAPMCSGDKVAFDGKIYITFASHCALKNSNLDNFSNDGAPYQNITNTSDYEYAVGVDDFNNPIAFATGISMSARMDRDFALMEVQPNLKGAGGPTFDDIKSLDVSVEKKPPAIASPVAIASFPDAAGNKMTTITGRYLGTAYVASTMGYLGVADIVGINPNAPENDGCNYAASGSSAIGENGYIFEGLSMRNSIGYPSGLQNTEGNEDPANALQWRFEDMDKQLNIFSERFAILCMYNLRPYGQSYGEISNMRTAVDGFNHIPQPPDFDPHSVPPPEPPGQGLKP